MSQTDRRPVLSRLYPPLAWLMDRRGGRGHRQRLVKGLTGEVLEVGAGNGLNFAHYPKGVTGVVAVEPEPYLRDLAVRNAERTEVPIQVVAGAAGRLPMDEASVDAAVTSPVRCSVPDQTVALRELRRVLRPGGELRFFEHVVADAPRYCVASSGSLTGPCGRWWAGAAPSAVTRRRRSRTPGSRSSTSSRSAFPRVHRHPRALTCWVSHAPDRSCSRLYLTYGNECIAWNCSSNCLKRARDGCDGDRGSGSRQYVVAGGSG